MTNQDEKMLATVEEAVDMIRAAQHPDGYIGSYYTVRGIEKRWTNLRDMHELYCMGHLIETCVAYETLTSSGRLLEPVMKMIHHVDSRFGTTAGKTRGYPGHEEIEVGLLRLHEMTGDDTCLRLAKYFVLERGQRDEAGQTFFDREAIARGGNPYDDLDGDMKVWYRFPRDYQYHQADKPITETTEAKGHAVRATYFYTAAADLARLTGDDKIKSSLDAIWDDMTTKKLYLTGGIGAMRQWEGFGNDYVLGDLEEDGTCYAETCASFALIFWCQRMLQLDLRSKYADVMEVALYNGFLGAVGQDGGSFYYQNPLRTYSGKPKERSTWFEVACCPPNVAKLLAQLGSLIYSYTEDTVAVHLYIESEFDIPNSDCSVSIVSDMPWSGDVEIQVKGDVKLALRIPSWAQSHHCSHKGQVQKGYLYLSPPTDATIKLKFPLKARRVYANPKLNKDEVAIMRGPLVYCLEDCDNAASVDKLGFVDDEAREGSSTTIAQVKCVVPIIAKGRVLQSATTESLYGDKPWRYSEQTLDIVYVPFFLRANRGGTGGMRVWTRRLASSI